MPAMLLQAPPDPADDFSGQVRFGFGAGSDPRHQEVFERRLAFLVRPDNDRTGGGMIARENRRIGRRCIGRPWPPSADGR
jgi:hypothetical protein